MRNLLIVLSMLLVFGATSAIACDEPNCFTITNSDVEAGVYTDALDYRTYSHNPNGEDNTQSVGQAGHAFDIEAKGTKSAYAHGEGDSNMYGFGIAFQKEVNGGELSGAGALTIATSEVSGHAKGVDARECNTGADKAKVDLEVFGYAAQANNAFSDDRDSWVGGGNVSDVDFYAHSDRTDYGSNDQSGSYFKYRGKRKGDYSWYNGRMNYVGKNRGYYDKIYYNIPDLTAEARDSLSATAIAAGGTLVYAKQTKNSAVVAGVTAGMSTATFTGAEEREVAVSGNGAMSGAANLPGNGFAAFGGDYSYQGQNFGAGVTGGTASVIKSGTSNTTSVQTNATSFSAVGVDCEGRCGSDNK